MEDAWRSEQRVALELKRLFTAKACQAEPVALRYEASRPPVEPLERPKAEARRWSRFDENCELRRELQGRVVRREAFESLAEENRWLRREATAKLLEAVLAPESAASTRLPTPAHSTSSRAGQ